MRENSATETPDSNQPVDLDTEAPDGKGSISDATPAQSPELRRWMELADVNSLVVHNGDASKVIAVPRPQWSDAEYDHIASSADLTQYRSAPAIVALSRMAGLDDGGWWEPAAAEVSAKLYGSTLTGVGMTVRKRIAGHWESLGFSLTVDEAYELASVLLAAADLAVSE
jgi:hypothetical protein